MTRCVRADALEELAIEMAVPRMVDIDVASIVWIK